MEYNNEKGGKKRRKPLKDDATENLKVEVDLRDKIVKDLLKKLKDDNWGDKVVSMWNKANSDRSDWLQRQEILLSDYDEFLESTAEGPFEGSSSLHLPLTFIVVKTLHARFLQALLGPQTSFQTNPRNDAVVERAPVVHELMRYVIDKHMNQRMGIFKPVDLWIWHWITTGCGFIKAYWDRRFTRYKDVDEEMVPGIPLTQVTPDGQEILQPTLKKKETEVDRKELLWEGACLNPLFAEDVVVIGEDNNDDPQTADSVIQKQRVTRSYLYSMADQGVFDKEAVDKVIESGGDKQYSTETNIKEQRTAASGQKDINNDIALDRYTVMECYTKACVDDSGMDSDIVIWVHAQSREILRATYLHRINKNGKRPIFKADFLRRPGQPYSMGLPEILHPISVEMDAMHNMRIDFGLISTLPFGFYRPTSSINPSVIKLTPGCMIPVDNPQTDVFFPNLGSRTAFGHQEEASLQSWADRLTSVSDLTLGMVSGKQGATRTATGVQGVIGEFNANLDVFLRRLNEGWKQVLEFILDLHQQRLPSGFVFRATADSALAGMWIKLGSREEIRGDFDIDVSPNSSASNQQVLEQRADQIVQMTSNPIDFQLGIVTPLQRYEALKNWMQVHGIKDVGKFLQRPQGMERQFTPEEEANRILRGVSVPISPMADHEGFIKFVQAIMKDEQLLGQFDPDAIMTLQAQAIKHQQMVQALKQMAAQQRNAQQMQINSNMGPRVQQPGIPTGQGEPNAGV